MINIWWSKACRRPCLIDPRASSAYLRCSCGRLCTVIFLLQVASDALSRVLHPHSLDLLPSELLQLLNPPSHGQILMLRVQRVLCLLARGSDLEKVRLHCLLLLMILKKGSIQVKFDSRHAMKGYLSIYHLKRHASSHSRHDREYFFVVRCLVFKLLEDHRAKIATVSTNLKGNLLALLLVLFC